MCRSMLWSSQFGWSVFVVSHNESKSHYSQAFHTNPLETLQGLLSLFPSARFGTNHDEWLLCFRTIEVVDECEKEVSLDSPPRSL